MMDRLNAALSGRYRIEELVGRGGMATVYRALDQLHLKRDPGLEWVRDVRFRGLLSP